MSRPAAFLDRDGVINIDHGYVSRWEDFAYVPGAVDALRRLQAAGYALVIVTNQSGVARGYYDEAAVAKLHDALRQDLAAQGVTLAAVEHCPHLPDAQLARYAVDCDCRKPAPGMILRSAQALGIDLAASLMFGDKSSDIEAGQRAGVGRCMRLAKNGEPGSADTDFIDLPQALNALGILDVEPTIYLDLTDLIHWAKRHSTVTGIQRVHLNYALNAAGSGVRFVMFHGRDCERADLLDGAVVEYLGRLLSGRTEPDAAVLYRLCPNARLEPWSDYRAKYQGKPAKYLWHTIASALKFHVRQLLFQRDMPTPPFKPGDILLNVGRSWTLGGYVRNIERLKRRHGLSVQLLLHDVIPVRHVQKSGESRIFTEFVRQSFAAFDRFFTSSDYNRREIRQLMHEFTGSEKPVEKCLFGQHINSQAGPQAPLPSGLDAGRYLLSVGRIAASKNQARLLQAWAQLVEAHQDAGLRLVFVGKADKGYRDLDATLAVHPALRERVLFLGEVSDETLDALYRGCHFTVFPSLIEGYGLPAAESVSYGKFCLASNAASIPEAAGPHAGYFDPLDVDNIRTQLAKFIQDGALLREHEALIQAMPRIGWSEATVDLLARVRRPLTEVPSHG